MLVHHDAVGVAAIRDTAEMLIRRPVSEHHVGAKLLQSFLAGGAGTVRTNQATDGS
jgi:hypothetical protein